MPLLHDYIASQLAAKLAARHIVVWYDERSEFLPFVVELRGKVAASEPAALRVAGMDVRLAEYTGSFLGLRAAVEPLVAGADPAPLIVYVPGVAHDRQGSVLMELEMAGQCWEPQLKQLARVLLRKQFTDGTIDALLGGDGVGYEDLARAAAVPARAGTPRPARRCAGGDRHVSLRGARPAALVRRAGGAGAARRSAGVGHRA